MSTTYTLATATDRYGESIFLHAGDSQQEDGRYTWGEIVADAEAMYARVVENDEPTLTVTHRTDDGHRVTVTIVGIR